ncbi:F-box only protein 42 [Mortierella sp. GBA39]|nr:F-box only protein 42 [Mortierella sp. GBA39]
MRHRDVLNHHPAMLHAIVALSAILCLVTAEQPIPVHSMAYATVNEKTLYIQGGDPGQIPFANQFCALDLTQPNWNTSNPPWTILSAGAGLTGAPASANHFMTVGNDSQSLMIWSSVGRNNVATSSSDIVEYKLSSSKWLARQELSNANGSLATYPGFAKSGATDPGTNLIYIPAVSQMDTGMTVFDITGAAISSNLERSTTTAPMPPPLVEGRVLTGHSTVWSGYRGSLLVYGGRYEVPPTTPATNSTTAPLQPAVFSDRLVEYNPTQKNWTIIETKGGSPGKIARHCMVPAEGGRKMIVFGGSIGTGATIVPQGGIYILDIPSWTWSQGTSVDSSGFRAAMACSVAADNFIAWGGTDGNNTLSSMIIYNLSSEQWTTQFSLGGQSSSTSSDTSHLGGIIGGGVAAAVVVGAIAGYIIYRRHRWRALQDYEPQGQDSRKHGYDLDAIKRNPHEPVDPLASKGIPRDPASTPLEMEFHFPPGHQVRNPEYAPIVHFQGFQRTDPQYSDTPLREPWRNPHGMAIPEHVNEDETLRQQWILEQQQAALYQHQQKQQAEIFQQQQQLYLSELDRLRREYEQLQTGTPSTPSTPTMPRR